MDWLKTFRRPCFEHLDERDDLDRPATAGSRLGPPEMAERRELAEAVLRAVAALPPTYRVPLTMFHMHGHSYDDISYALDIPLATTKSRLHNARTRLRAILEHWGN